MIDVHEIKLAASGQWRSILVSLAGIPDAYLDGRHHPCPWCPGGRDRFRLLDITNGAVLCNKCHNSQNGDGIAAIQKANGCDFPAAIEMLAKHLGIDTTGDSPTKPTRSIDLLQKLANLKGCTREGLAEYGGEVQDDRVVFPVYGPDKLQCSTFTIWPNAPAGDKRLKGMLAKGRPSGMYFPFMDQGVHFPVPSESWIVCEGVKDSAAWYALGFHAAGANGEDLVRQPFVPLFRDVHVILAPDRTTQAESKAKESAARLHGVAASIRICQLPLKIATKEAITHA